MPIFTQKQLIQRQNLFSLKRGGVVLCLFGLLGIHSVVQAFDSEVMEHFGGGTSASSSYMLDDALVVFPVVGQSANFIMSPVGAGITLLAEEPVVVPTPVTPGNGAGGSRGSGGSREDIAVPETVTPDETTSSENTNLEPNVEATDCSEKVNSCIGEEIAEEVKPSTSDAIQSTDIHQVAPEIPTEMKEEQLFEPSDVYVKEEISQDGNTSLLIGKTQPIHVDIAQEILCVLPLYTEELRALAFTYNPRHSVLEEKSLHNVASLAEHQGILFFVLWTSFSVLAWGLYLHYFYRLPKHI